VSVSVVHDGAKGCDTTIEKLHGVSLDIVSVY
jgi:hypothetical protein